MQLIRTYSIEREQCVGALEEIADRFLINDLIEKFSDKVTFKGFISGRPLPKEEPREQFPSYYWFGRPKEDKIPNVFGMVAGINRDLCIHILNTAHNIWTTGEHSMFDANYPTRFMIRPVLETHTTLLGSMHDCEERFQVNILGGQGYWHLYLHHYEGLHQITLGNNWNDAPTLGFENLYELLFGSIYEKHGGVKK